MIKKYLLWLWISLFWFVWFWYCFPDLISVVPWEAYNWDNVYVDDFVLSENLTFTKPVTYINSDLNVEYAFYWDQNWYLHFFVNDTKWKSDYIINSYMLVDLSWNSLELSQSEFINYVNNHSVYKVDFYFWYSCQNDYNHWTTFSIHFDNWNYIYFAWGVCQWNNLYVTPWGWPKQSPTNWTIAWLVSYNSPFSIYWTDIPINNMDNIYCPTIQQLINNYNLKWFSSWLCYSSDKIFNWSSFVSVWSQSIFDLFSSKDDYLTALEWYWTYCESSVYNSSVCADYFSWQELRFNIISKLPNNLDVVWWRKQLYTYCNLYNYDPNSTTCVSSWVTADVWTEITNQDVLHSLVNWDYSIFSPITNNSEYDTVFNNWSWYEYSWDIISNIQNLFWKFTSLFRQQTWNSPWILPLWIIIPFIIIILFKLFKK